MKPAFVMMFHGIGQKVADRFLSPPLLTELMYSRMRKAQSQMMNKRHGSEPVLLEIRLLQEACLSTVATMQMLWRPYRAKTKGKVERPYCYVRQDFFLARSFRNLDDLNTQFGTWLAEVVNPRRHATTRQIVIEAFAEETLQTPPAIPYSAAITVERRISRDGMVSVDGNLYSD